jgi:hypothetical protein
MTMSKIKTAIFAVVAAAGITTIIVQHQAAAKLRAENNDLSLAQDELSKLREENGRLSKQATNNPEAKLTKAQESELLRLRSEVGRLRADLRKAQANNRGGAADQNAANANADESNKPFTTAITARVGNGQTLIAGGWTTSPGVRSFVVMTPVIDPASGVRSEVTDDGKTFTIPNASVTISANTIEVPEAMLAQFGLDRFKADGHESSMQNVLTEDEAQALLKLMKDPNDGISVTRSRITTADGNAASISRTQDPSTVAADQPPVTEYRISLTPSITADKSSVDLAISAQLLRLETSSGSSSISNHGH